METHTPGYATALSGKPIAATVHPGNARAILDWRRCSLVVSLPSLGCFDFIVVNFESSIVNRSQIMNLV